MKLYQIIMKVPDDFVPEEMQLTASFKDVIEICSEGFIGPESFIEVEEESAKEFDPDSYYGEITDLEEEDNKEDDSEKGESESEEVTASEGEEVVSNSEEDSKECAEGNEE